MCHPQSAQWDWDEWEEELLMVLLLTALSSEKMDAFQSTPLHVPSTWQCHMQGAELADVKVSGVHVPCDGVA